MFLVVIGSFSRTSLLVSWRNFGSWHINSDIPCKQVSVHGLLESLIIPLFYQKAIPFASGLTFTEQPGYYIYFFEIQLVKHLSRSRYLPWNLLSCKAILQQI